ncbi:hypothetical protein DFH29DRAFT_957977 [Suillus ampliporus]|nr:hypothetical protein DFH29DRAFT_957977 [Suillus ampliporus]
MIWWLTRMALVLPSILQKGIELALARLVARKGAHFSIALARTQSIKRTNQEPMVKDARRAICVIQMLSRNK